MSKENVKIYNAIDRAMEIQDFLWGDQNLSKHKFTDVGEVWDGVLQKRIDKIKAIDFANPNAKVELRKRLLQLASLSIQALKAVDNNY